MDNNAINRETLFDKFENYTKTSITLFKLSSVEKSADVLSSLTSQVTIILIALMFILFTNIGLALWLGKLLNEYFLGFFIVSGFYLVLALVVFIFRNQMIKRPINDMVIKKLIQKTDLDAIIQSN
ncbi:MAG: hypothetical protein V4670_03160 [Bacteroidota bacterium]